MKYTNLRNCIHLWLASGFETRLRPSLVEKPQEIYCTSLSLFAQMQNLIGLLWECSKCVYKAREAMSHTWHVQCKFQWWLLIYLEQGLASGKYILTLAVINQLLLKSIGWDPGYVRIARTRAGVVSEQLGAVLLAGSWNLNGSSCRRWWGTVALREEVKDAFPWTPQTSETVSAMGGAWGFRFLYFTWYDVF